MLPVLLTKPALGLVTTCGGRALAPQPLPTYLEPYNDRCLELTEAALADSSVHCTRGVRYGDEPHQVLDLWAPATGAGGGTGLLPIVFGVHGGGWEFGYPEWAGFPAQHVCAAPALFITPAYTLGGGGQRQAWPAARDDLLLALKWVAEHGAEAGGDPSQLVLTGHSAGGHYAACLGLNPPLLRAAGLSPEAVRALFLVSCPVGLRARDFAPKRWLWRLWVGRPLVTRLYNKVIARNLAPVVGAPPDEATAAEASPLLSMRAAAPAELPPLVHVTFGGKGDFPFCGPQARLLQAEARRMRSDGGPRVELLVLPEASHFDTHYEMADGGSEWHAALRRVLADL
jgi:arylformamidase